MCIPTHRAWHATPRVIVGRTAGSGLSSEIDASLDQADRLYAARTRQAALETRPSAVISRWQNPTTGNTGAIMPTRTYSENAGAIIPH